MLMIWYRPATSGFSSVFSFRTFSFPAYSFANSSTMGATIWQGPHHTAQKSTMTSSDAFITSASQLESSTFKASPATSAPSFRIEIITSHCKAWYPTTVFSVKQGSPSGLNLRRHRPCLGGLRRNTIGEEHGSTGSIAVPLPRRSAEEYHRTHPVSPKADHVHPTEADSRESA